MSFAVARNRRTSPRVMGGQASRQQKGMEMDGRIYRVIELAGSSEKSIEDAVEHAIKRASETLRHIGWFEIVQTRGHVEDGRVRHYQVLMKVGFTLEDKM